MFTEKAKYLLLLLLFFSLGVGYYFQWSVIFFLLYLILYVEREDFSRIFSNSHAVVFFVLSISFFVILFARGVVYMTPPGTDQTFIKCLFYTTVPFVILTLQADKIQKKNLLYMFLFGMFLYSITVIFYSYFLDSDRYGYRHLFNPFLSAVVSSTNYSNNIALTFCAGVIVFCMQKHWTLKLIAAFVVFFSLAGVFITLGRAYWIIVTTFLILFPFFSGTSSKKVIISLISICFLLLTSYLIYRFALPENLVIKYDRFMLSRLESLLKRDNIRYLLWKEGFLTIFKFPMGGYVPLSVNQYWFHNIWLDTARVAGVIPLTLFLIINLYTVFLWISVRKDPERNVFILLSIISLMIMGQDLVIENRDRILTLYFYLMIHFYLFSKPGDQRINSDTPY